MVFKGGIALNDRNVIRNFSWTYNSFVRIYIPGQDIKKEKLKY